MHAVIFTPAARQELVNQGLPPATAEYVVRLHGAEAPAVARLARSNRSLAQPIVPGHPALRAQLIHAIQRELALTLTDLLLIEQSIAVPCAIFAQFAARRTRGCGAVPARERGARGY